MSGPQPTLLRRVSVRPGVLRALRSGPMVTTAWAFLGGLVLVAVLADVIATHDPMGVSSNLLAPPSSEHLLGTDDTGKDIFSGLVHGTRVTLLVGLAAALGNLVIGGAIGLLAGYFGGWIDSMLMRLAEVFQVMPAIVVTIVAVAMLGSNTVVICTAIVIATWPQTARIMRAQVLAVRQAPFVDAARVNGYSWPRITAQEILPLTMTAVTIQAALEIGRAILFHAGLAFLGLSDPSVPAWGEMLRRAQPYLDQAWQMSVIPGLLILGIVLAVNVVCESVTTRLSPLERQDT